MRESFDGFMSGKRPLTEVKEEGAESHDDDSCSRKLFEADYGRACELSYLVALYAGLACRRSN